MASIHYIFEYTKPPEREPRPIWDVYEDLQREARLCDEMLRSLTNPVRLRELLAHPVNPEAA